MLILLPVVAAVIYLTLTVVARFPVTSNYSVRVTKENRLRLQNVTLDMLAWLKAELLCLFAVLQWWIMQAARTGQGRLPSLLMPGFLVIIFATAGWQIVAAFRAARTDGGSRNQSRNE